MILPAALLYLSAAQLHWLNIAYDEGQKYGLPKYVQAVILTESSACANREGDDGRSLGCGQLQASTARSVCRCKIEPDILLANNSVNIRITAHFLSDCFTQFWPDRNRAILCFNIGSPKASQASAYQVKHSKYVARVLAWLKVLKDIPVDHE